MSQGGPLNTEDLPPDVATSFVCNVGVATPAANLLNVLGAGGATTTGIGNTITVTAAATDETTFVTDSGSAISINDSINVFGGANINTAGAGDTVTIALDSDVVTNSYSTDTIANNLKIEDNTITAGGTNANVDIGLVPKGTGGAYVVNNLTVGQPFSVSSIPFGGGSLDVAMLVDTEGLADLGGFVENRHDNIPAFGAHHILARTRGTHASPTTIVSGDTIGRLASFGFDGTEFVEATEITTSATGTIAAGKVPGQFVFSTADNITGALQTAMTIDNGQTTTVPRLVATQNVTANFTSPVTSVLLTNQTGGAQSFTSIMSTVSQSTFQTMLTGEYYGALSTNVGNAATLAFYRALGTKASPVGLTTSAQCMIGSIRFDSLGSSPPNSLNQMTISVFGNFTGNGAVLQMRQSTNSGWQFLQLNREFRSNGPISFHPRTGTSVTGATLNPTTYTRAGISDTIGCKFCTDSAFSALNRPTVFGFAANNTSPPIVLFAKSRNNFATPNAVQSGDSLGSLAYAGTTVNASSTVNAGAAIDATVEGAVSANIVPTRLGFFTMTTGGVLNEALRIDSAQRITQPLQPAFSASLSADVVNATGDGTAYTIAFDTEQYDRGSNFAANTFTAPIAGIYRFNYTISVDDLLVGHTKMEVTVGGRMVERCNPFAIADSDGFCLMSGSVDLSLAASATVTMVVTISGSTKTVTVKGTTSSGTFLSGQLQV